MFGLVPKRSARKKKEMLRGVFVITFRLNLS